MGFRLNLPDRRQGSRFGRRAGLSTGSAELLLVAQGGSGWSPTVRALADEAGDADILVSNAAAFTVAPTSEQDAASFDGSFTTNVRASYFLTAALAPRMTARAAADRRCAILTQGMSGGSTIDLYWLPLGAGGHSVRLNGRVYEAVAARLARRPECDLYHSALGVCVPEGSFVIEQTPAVGSGEQRGVVAEGAVGSRWAGRFRIFRYELRCWRNGVIPDVAEAVESPKRLSDDPRLAQLLLDLVPSVPTPVWGRDELGTGEMWNSNSFVSWLVARSGLAAELIRPPVGGRAPGWNAGLEVARRQDTPR